MSLKPGREVCVCVCCVPPEHQDIAVTPLKDPSPITIFIVAAANFSLQLLTS